MLPIFTAEEMHELDRRAIEGLKIPGLVLMETAARGVFRTALEILESMYGPAVPLPLGLSNSHNGEDDHECGNHHIELPSRMIASGRRIAVFCGGGNNGGDGLAVARMLDSAGAEVEIILLANAEDYTGDAAKNLILATELGLNIIENAEEDTFDILEGTHLVIDALLGTGIKGAARGRIAEAIEDINDAPCPVLSIDIPSGVEGSSGRVEGPAVNAYATVTMAALKRGLVFSPGRELAGEVSIVDIGTPRKIVEEFKPYLFQLEPDDIINRLPVRAVDTHKGECGRVFIIAGSPGLTGAAAMSASACVKSGAGLVIVGCPKSLNPILEIKLTEAMTVPLPETAEGAISKEALAEIQRRLEWANACAIGPGLGRSKETIEVVIEILEKLTLPVVIDADGLFALAQRISNLKKLPEKTILTPHYGEFARLCGITVDEVKFQRVELLREKAVEWNTVIILKGAPTLIGDTNGNVYLVPTGNPGMAAGGVGDVLTGVVSSLLGQGLEPADAAVTGAYLHGLAGDLASGEQGFFGLSASDIIEYLPEAFKDFGC
ncbi:MAG: NAD(P)H-hydrate dehydratase [FCB group bacterium]|nr:NAD(P)H-hydrate dehydratase [FCB group bacterium]